MSTSKESVIEKGGKGSSSSSGEGAVSKAPKKEQRASKVDKQTQSKASSSRRPSKKRSKAFDDDDASDDQRLDRTIFVGNISVNTKPSALKKFFTKIGKVESVRMRSAAVEGTKVEQAGNQKAMRKACYIKGKFNTEVSETCNAYVVFRDPKDVKEALSLNGKMLGDHHLNVDRATAAGGSGARDIRRSVFIGNIAYNATDEQIWKWFGQRVAGGMDCIERVRLIRDPETRVGKGIGYVTFKTPMAVLSALGLDGGDFGGRKLRIQRCKKTSRSSNKRNEASSGDARRRRRRPKSRHVTSASSFEGERVTMKNQSNAMKRIARKQKRRAAKMKQPNRKRPSKKKQRT